MDFFKDNILPHLIELIALLVLYFVLLYLFKLFKYKITKEKVAQLAVLILVAYFVLSIVLGIFSNINK
jgi:hypothetical protein